MITEDYVSFEVAKLLKEKGFDVKSVKVWYDESGEMYYDRHEVKYQIKIENHEKFFQCPSLQMAMKWLREVHGLHVGIDPLEGNWCTKIVELEDLCEVDKGIALYGTYEEACEAGIRYCLENLI